MAAQHGTRGRYNEGCRCDRCKEAHRLYQRQYRERKANGLTRPCSPVPVVQLPDLQPAEPGPVEVAVEVELGGLPAAPKLRPSLAAVALAMARILDGRVPTPKPAAAKVLVTVLDTLHKSSAQGRRGNLAAVRSITKKGGA
jgi:hypothetical protein